MVLFAVDSVCAKVNDLNPRRKKGFQKLSAAMNTAAKLCGEVVVQHVPVSLLSSKSFLVKLINKKYGFLALESILKRIPVTSDLLVTVLSRSAMAVNYVDPKYLEEHQVADAALKGGAPLYMLPKSLAKDKQFVLGVIRSDRQESRQYEWIDDAFWNDKDIQLEGLSRENNCLELIFRAGWSIMEDDKLVREALSVNPLLFSEVSSELRDDRELVLNIVKEHGDLVGYASTRLQVDPEIALEAWISNTTYEDPPDELRSNLGFLLQLMDCANDKLFVIEYADPEFRSHPDLLRRLYSQECLRSYEEDFESSDYYWWGESFEFAMASVKVVGSSLEHFSEEIRNNRKVVKSAILNDPFAIAYASQSLRRKSRRLNELAVQQNPATLKSLSRRFRKDVKLVLKVIDMDCSMIAYAHPVLQLNPAVVVPWCTLVQAQRISRQKHSKKTGKETTKPSQDSIKPAVVSVISPTA